MSPPDPPPAADVVRRAVVEELLRLHAHLARRERKARAKVEHLGRALARTRASRRPIWRRGFSALRRALWRRDAPPPAAPRPAPGATPALDFAAPRTTLALSGAWARIAIDVAGPWVLWVTPLSVGVTVVADIGPASDDGAVRAITMPVAVPSRAAAGTEQTLLRLRGTGGVRGLLRLDLRAAGLPPPDPLFTAPTPPPPPPKPRPAVPAAPASRAHAVWRAAGRIPGEPWAAVIAEILAGAAAIERPAVRLLQANFAGADDAVWLDHVNAYVAAFGIAPLTLAAGEGPRFHRLGARPARAVEHGPLVSVVMPAFDAEDTLAVAARSILAQTWRPLELLIVDDASRDGTPRVIAELAAADPRVRSVRNAENAGPYVAKNLALSVARGAYVTGHDADDWAHPQRIERQVTAMIAAEGAIGAAHARMLRMSAAGVFTPMRVNDFSDDGLLRVSSISCMFEASVLRDTLGFWDTARFGADSELIGRAETVLGGRFVPLRQLAMVCLDRPGSLTTDPVTGIARDGTPAPVRLAYRAAWEAWHATLTPESAYLPFPQRVRRFAASEDILVPDGVVARLHQAVAAGKVLTPPIQASF